MFSSRRPFSSSESIPLAVVLSVLCLVGTPAGQYLNGTSIGQGGQPSQSDMLCRIGTHDVSSVASMPANNRLFVLDIQSSCSGILKSVCAVFATPLDRSVLNNSEILLATYAIHVVAGQLSLELSQGPILVKPSEVVYDTDSVNAILIVNISEGTSLPVRKDERIGVLFRASEDLQINSTNTFSTYQPREQISTPSQAVELGTRMGIAPFVWFGIGEETAEGNVSPSSPNTNNTNNSRTMQPTQGTSLPPTEQTDEFVLMIGIVATIVAAFLVVLACSVLFVTVGLKVYKKRKNEVPKDDAESGSNEDSIRRPSAASILSQHLVLQSRDRAQVTTSSMPNLNDSVVWPLNNVLNRVFSSRTLPQHEAAEMDIDKTLPFPIPNYEMQSTLSTIAISDRLGTAHSMTATMRSTVTEGPYDIPADDQERPINVTLNYSKADYYDDIVDTPYEAPPSKEDKICDYLRRKDLFRVERDEIKIEEYIGSGNFADIHKAIWSKPKQEQYYVATKTLVSKSPKDKVRFLQEAHIMSQFNHNNIVKIHGVLAEKKPVMLVLELLQGDLRQFLKDKGALLAETCPDDLQTMFLRFSREIAAGMKYLSKKGFIHRDLAARNVLTTEDLTCKISDFGLARDLSGDAIYQSRGGSIPVKWTAPEALHYGSYTGASDVWSFGVVLSEIWSLGQKPYNGLRNEHVLSFLESGQRLAPPPGCPNAIYSVMMDCWHPDPDPRPTFVEIESKLSGEDHKLLEIVPEEDLRDKRAIVLGSNLITGNYLYPALQNRYLFYCEYGDDGESPTSNTAVYVT